MDILASVEAMTHVLLWLCIAAVVFFLADTILEERK